MTNTHSKKNQCPAFAQNLAQLAKALETSRQALNYHSRRPDAPQCRQDGRHDIAAWATYLRGRTRLIVAHHEADPRETALRWVDGYQDGIFALAKLLDGVLPTMAKTIGTVCDLKLSKPQRERLSWAIARIVDSAANDILQTWELPLLDEADDE